MNITEKEYKKLVKKHSPPSKKCKNCAWAFLFGGLICALGQILKLLYEKAALGEEKAFALVSITIIFVTAVLTGTGVFDKIAKKAGAGTLVPVSGFANSVVSPAIEFKSESIVLGLCAKLFSIAGPVIVFGLTTSVIYGVIYWLSTIIAG